MSQIPRSNPKIPEGINHTTEHPLKEFAQLFFGVCAGLVVLTFVISLSIRFLAPFIPFSWEKKTGPLVERFLSDENAGENSNALAKQALQQLGERLLASGEMMGTYSDIGDTDIQSTDFSFHLIHSDVPNAYASFGGHIFVTDALIEQVSSENGLAMVIAHEIAHIRYRHPIASASRGIVLQLVLYAFLGHSTDGSLSSLLSGSSLLTLLSFNRDMESEADESALDLIYRHYGTYEGADEFFETMAKESDSILWLEFAQTHPHTQRRLDTIQKRIAEQRRVGVEITPMPVNLRPLETSRSSQAARYNAQAAVYWRAPATPPAVNGGSGGLTSLTGRLRLPSPLASLRISSGNSCKTFQNRIWFGSSLPIYASFTATNSALMGGLRVSPVVGRLYLVNSIRSGFHHSDILAGIYTVFGINFVDEESQSRPLYLRPAHDPEKV